MKVTELFAGIGSWSKALEKLGIQHELVCAVENDVKTIESYNLIHGANFKPLDIRSIEASEVPNCDVIFYSPPCQAFSFAGRQEGFGDQRGTLFFDALRIIQAKKPKYAIMENVKGLTQKKFQFEFETMLQLLEKEGYSNHWAVLNSLDYDMPLFRERIFIVSIRNDIENIFTFPSRLSKTKSVKDILEEGFDRKHYLSDKMIECLSRHKATHKSKGHGFGWNPVGKDTPYIKSLKANYWKIQGDADFIIEDDGIRKLTPLECMRLMGFEDQDYQKLKNAKISNTQIYKMVGNSIVVNVVENILKSLFSERENIS